MQTSLTLRAAPPLESPSSFVKMAPVIPISRLKVETNTVNLWKEKYGQIFMSHNCCTNIGNY